MTSAPDDPDDPDVPDVPGVPGAVEMGAGAHRILSVDGRGRVVAVYRRAAYLRLPAGLVALTGSDVWRGPLHVRSPLRPELLAPGDPVVVEGGCLRVGAHQVDLTGCPVWRGRLPRPADLACAPAGVAAAVFSAAPPSALLDPRFEGRLAVAHRRLRHNDLAGVATALGGLGPGLTPSGDDALAGILLARRALGGPGLEAWLVEVAGGVRTTSVARGLLDWAARGQSVEPVHDLLGALAAGDGAGAVRHVADLARLGHTSGADLLHGLALGLGLGVRVGLVSPG